MGKLVVLSLGEGDFQRGFPVTLQVWEEGGFHTSFLGKLPASAIDSLYDRWQSDYRQKVSGRMTPKPAQVSNRSDTDLIANSKLLKDELNNWLNSETFRPIKEKFLEKVNTRETVRVIVQTENPQLRRLPWYLWDLFVERYRFAEVALSSPTFDRAHKSVQPKAKVRILAILGDSSPADPLTGIRLDINADKQFLESLPDAETVFLVEPKHYEFNEQLWDERGWDILFFAGHSSSQPDGTTGKMYINSQESLTVEDLKLALKKAIERGLQLAIFNSCDGLGIARDLAELQIPQIIAMREPVSDSVAKEFLKYFLTSFSSGKILDLAVREARERLHGVEKESPCASWLPVICQNPAEIPPFWNNLSGKQTRKSQQLLSVFKDDCIAQELTFKEVINHPHSLVGYKLGAYLLQVPIGSGGSGLVYRAWNSSLSLPACIKIFYPFKSDLAGIVQAIARGVMGVAALNHPNIVKVFDFQEFQLSAQTSFYIAMEFVYGKTLDEWIEELPDDNKSVHAKLQVAYNITMALKTAHKCKYIDEVGFEQTGVLHGDIKPTNIIISPNNLPVLIDFMMVDVQRLLDPNIVPSYLFYQPMPITGVFGTPGFMAPEQEQQGIVTIKTDIYSLGMTLFSLFFSFDEYGALLRDEFPVNSKLHDVLSLLRQMVNQNPDMRPTDMAVVAARLEKIAATFNRQLLNIPNQVTCTNCKHLLKPNIRFCEKCGVAVAKVSCMNCKGLLKPNVSFCEKCGYRVI